MHMPGMNRLEVLENTLIHVDCDGSIVSVTQPEAPDYEQRLHTARHSGVLVETGSQQLIIPGLVDLHVHAPQWPQLGKALHLPLQDWLNQHTFPLEARYQDIDCAQQVYPSLVSTLLANGTTTAMYFATVHEEATRLLASTCQQLGQSVNSPTLKTPW